jgi:hypothetical protein
LFHKELKVHYQYQTSIWSVALAKLMDTLQLALCR